MSIRPFSLSEEDKKILEILSAPNGQSSSKALATKVGIHATTIRTRRRRLEKAFLKISYTLDLSKFGRIELASLLQ